MSELERSKRPPSVPLESSTGGLRAALERAAANNHEEGSHGGYAGPASFRDCADTACMDAAAALAVTRPEPDLIRRIEALRRGAETEDGADYALGFEECRAAILATLRSTKSG